MDSVDCPSGPVEFDIKPLFNCGIDLTTPPLGSVLFVSSASDGVSTIRSLKTVARRGPDQARRAPAVIWATAFGRTWINRAEAAGQVSDRRRASGEPVSTA